MTEPRSFKTTMDRRVINSLAFKPDFADVRARFEAWWRKEVTDRFLLAVSAPRDGAVPEEKPRTEEEIRRWWTDPETVAGRWERHFQRTYLGGDELPVAWVDFGPGIMAALLGAELRFLDTFTGWVNHPGENWTSYPKFGVDPEHPWWRMTCAVLTETARVAHDRFLVTIPDINGPGEVLARLRGPEALCIDLVERPGEVRDALEDITDLWFHYFREYHRVVHGKSPGYLNWLAVWSDASAADLQCDFSCMISPAMFQETFIPSLRRQAEKIDHTIYHLDGPGAVRHLETILSISEIDGIQWVPGAGAPPMSTWIDLLRRIHDAGKLLHLDVPPDEAAKLLDALPVGNTFIRTRCETIDEAKALLRKADHCHGSK